MPLNGVVNTAGMDAMFGRSHVKRPVAFPDWMNRHKWLRALSALKRSAVWEAQVVPYSYRGFCVGCAALVCRSDLPPESGGYGIVGCGNLKIQKGWPKKCAEMSVLEIAGQLGYTRVVGFAIYSEAVQPDENGHASRTLHPCCACRAAMAASPLVTAETRIFTFRPHIVEDPERKERVREHMSFAELLQIHANGNGADCG